MFLIFTHISTITMLQLTSVCIAHNQATVLYVYKGTNNTLLALSLVCNAEEIPSLLGGDRNLSSDTVHLSQVNVSIECGLLTITCGYHLSPATYGTDYNIWQALSVHEES